MQQPEPWPRKRFCLGVFHFMDNRQNIDEKLGLNIKKFSSRNVSELETVQRAIHHIPELLDAAMAAMMETNIQPPEVEVLKL